MNKRIRELAEQSGLEFDDDEVLEFGKQIYYVTKEDMAKFAELIVKDCACVPTDMWGAGELDVHTAVQVHRQILKHFGVKE